MASYDLQGPIAVTAAPSPDNHYLAEHIQLLRQSYRQLVGRDLVDPQLDSMEAAKAIYQAPYVVVSHGTEADPIFNYANQTALQLFAMTWKEFTSLPSRQSAEPPNRDERARLLEMVTNQGYIADYSGIRIASTGQRFCISDVTVWNLTDPEGVYRGQAATYSRWEFL